MSHHRLVFVGFGNVGRAVARLLLRKQTVLERDYGIIFTATGIATGSHGFAANPAGIDLQRAIDLVEGSSSITPLGDPRLPTSDSLAVIRASQGDILFENSPVNHSTGQPAIDHIRAGLEAGMHALTANKGTVVHGYQELSALATARGRKFYFESTVLGGSPVFSVFRECMPAAELQSFRGVLNSTTNMILTRMERGETFEGAVKYCQSIGVAETDPSADVDGWDAAIKVAALVTVLMEQPLAPQQVNRQGIQTITAEMIAAAKTQGKRYKLVCSAQKDADGVSASVRPELVGISDPLYGMEDSTTGVAFRTDVLGDYSIIESERPGLVAGPDPTAYGLLTDFINAVRVEGMTAAPARALN
jgi:homoserine dehydrogenase